MLINTKSENKANERVVELITINWQQTYVIKPSEVSRPIYKVTHIENFTLPKVPYLNHFSCHGSDNPAWKVLSYCICGCKVLA